jgi:enoyl-CoA hydratase/carnithine racemase
MTYREIRLARHGPVAVLHLARPEVLNAYTPDMGEEIVHACRALAADGTVRALVFSGEGRTFCAGADRAFLAGAVSRSGHRLGEEHFISGFATELATLPLLTVAAINGAAAGIGVTMTLPMDLRVVASEVPLLLNFAELGILPGLGSTCLLPRLVGGARARELLLVRRRISGEEAAAMGLANLAVPAAEVLPRALEFAHAVAKCPRAVLAAIKQALAAGEGGTLEEACERERTLAAVLRAGKTEASTDG